MWRIAAPARTTQRGNVARALERRSVTVVVRADDHVTLKAQAREAGLSLPQFIRTWCGFPERHTSIPGLRALGLDPEPCFDD
jgi:hypothetical protein